MFVKRFLIFFAKYCSDLVHFLICTVDFFLPKKYITTHPSMFCESFIREFYILWISGAATLPAPNISAAGVCRQRPIFFISTTFNRLKTFPKTFLHSISVLMASGISATPLIRKNFLLMIKPNGVKSMCLTHGLCADSIIRIILML